MAKRRPRPQDQGQKAMAMAKRPRPKGAMDKDNKTVPIDDVIDFMTFFDVRPQIILHKHNNNYYLLTYCPD